mgnify:CR=1 FL=1
MVPLGMVIVPYAQNFRRLDSGGRLVHLAEWVYNPAAGGQI